MQNRGMPVMDTMAPLVGAGSVTYDKTRSAAPSMPYDGTVRLSD